MATGEVFDFTLKDSSLVGMLQKINSFTDVGQGGVLGIMILLIIGSALFLMMKTYGNERALLVSMFISSMLGWMLRILGLINDFIFYICVALFVIASVFLIKDSARYEPT